MGMGYGKGVSPSPLREGPGSAPPQNFFNFWVSNCIFWCILGAILSATLLNSAGRRATSGVLGGMAP